MKTEQSRMRIEGPLAPLASGFRNELAAQGYSPSWAVVQMRLLAGLSCWMAGKGLDADDIDVGVLAEFSAARHAAGGATSRVPDPGGVLSGSSACKGASRRLSRRSKAQPISWLIVSADIWRTSEVCSPEPSGTMSTPLDSSWTRPGPSCVLTSSTPVR